MLTENEDIGDFADLLGIDLEHVIGGFNVEYSSDERWGLVYTPAMADARSIVKKISYDLPHISTGVVYDILIHVFDNVANYGMIGGQAKGTVLTSLNDESLEISVCNLTDRVLPPTLKERTYSASDGVIVVPFEERDVETGGGKGVKFITQDLPQVYSYLVETDNIASVSWLQRENQVIFTLSIPTPSENELAVCNDYVSRREQEIGDFELASQYIINTKNPNGSDREYDVSIPAQVSIPVLRQALRSSVDFPEGRSGRFSELIDVLNTIRVYGQEASSASEEVIDVILCNASAIQGMKVLTAIEEQKGMYCDRFANLIEEYQGKDDMPLSVIADYIGSSFAHIPPEESWELKEKLIDVFVKREGQFDISSVLKEEKYLFIGETVNRLESEGDSDLSNKLIELYFGHVTESIGGWVDSLASLPEGKLKEKTVEKIAQEKEDESAYYAAKALGIVDGTLHEPLVDAIVSDGSACYAYEALGIVDEELHESLVGAIVSEGSAYYAHEALGIVDEELHEQLVDAIVSEGSAYHATKALGIVSEELHEPLVGAIVSDESAYHAHKALGIVDEELHEALVGAIVSDGSAYYAHEALGLVDGRLHGSLVSVIVGANSNYYATKALGLVKDKSLQRKLRESA